MTPLFCDVERTAGHTSPLPVPHLCLKRGKYSGSMGPGEISDPLHARSKSEKHVNSGLIRRGNTTMPLKLLSPNIPRFTSQRTPCHECSQAFLALYFTEAPRTSSPRTCVAVSASLAARAACSCTYHPSGRYRRTTRGIFFSRSSLRAIWRGSVIPSTSMRTGAFPLRNV